MKASDLPPDVQKRLLGHVERQKPKTSAEDTFEFQCKAHRLPPFMREYRFAEEIGRGWRFDFAWLAAQGKPLLCAVEIEGLVMRRVNGELIVGGRHVTPTGFRNDAIKYARAAIMGWSVLRFEQGQIKDGTAIDHIKELLKAKGWRPT